MKHILFVAAAVLIFTQCKKDHGGDAGGSQPVDDVRTVLLKDLVAQGLANPLYHFEYDARHYLTTVEYSAGENVFSLVYSDKRLSRMIDQSRNLVDKYLYTGRHVTRVDQYDMQEKLLLSMLLAYDSKGLLEQMEWMGHNGSDSGKLYRRVRMSYLPDSNLSTMSYFQDRGNGMEAAWTYTFSDYDQGINVDDFYMLNDFSDILTILPQVKLQRNNPRRVVLLGKNSEFQTKYEYLYNAANLPLKRIEHTVQVKGPHPGWVYDIVNEFSYY